MADYLLSLATLHAAAPGVLDVVFGADGDFAGAPRFMGPLFCRGDVESHYWPTSIGCRVATDAGPGDVAFVGTMNAVGWFDLDRLYLDCRIHAILARLLRLCSFVQDVDPNMEPAELASLTVALAPRIAALGGTRG